MGRVSIDERLADHPTVLAAGPLALALHVRALCWSRRHRTNGMIPESALPTLVADFPEREGWGAKMCSGGLWLSKPSGWVIPGVSPSRPLANVAPEEASQEVIPIEGPSPTTPPTDRTTKTAAAAAAGRIEGGGAEGEKGGKRVRIGVAASWKHAPWPSPAALAHLWNEKAPDTLPTVETLSPQRIQLAKELLANFPDREWWDEVFEQYRGSRFLSGRRPKSKEHSHFVADFDWLLRGNKHGERNCVRVHDGAFLD